MRPCSRSTETNQRIFNIAEDDGFVSIAKALRELGFDPGFRLGN
jgi:hypothetical protein